MITNFSRFASTITMVPRVTSATGPVTAPPAVIAISEGFRYPNWRPASLTAGSSCLRNGRSRSCHNQPLAGVAIEIRSGVHLACPHRQ